MAIPTSILIETARRYDSRKKLQKSRAERLKQVQWKPNMDVCERVRILKKLDDPDRVQKRLRRLGSVAFQYLNNSTDSISNLLTENKQAFDEVVLERVLGQTDLMNVNFLEKGSVMARTIGKIVMKNSLGGIVGYGTGFLISPKLVMTNNHVLPDTRDALYSHVEFDNQLDLAGMLMKSTTFRLDPQSFFVTSKELDVTVVAVAEAITSPNILMPYGFNKLIEAEGKVILGEYMNIIQHPDGRPKEFSFRANQLTDVLEKHLHYQTDTEPGSSGSPVYNDQWEVVALHHAGVPMRDSNLRILNKKSEVWDRTQGESQIQWVANEGIRASTLIRYLKSLTLQGQQKDYRDEIFDMDPPKYKLCYLSDEQYKRALQNGDVGGKERSDRNGIERGEDGSYYYNIPVRLKVEVGDILDKMDKYIKPSITGEAPAVTKSVINSGKAPVMPGSKSPVSSSRIGGVIQDDLKEALRELEAAKKKPYYEEALDKKQRDKFYGSIGKGRKTKAQFYQALNQLITEQHTTELTYRPAKNLYTWVDLQENRMLRSIYSGKEFEPEQVIEEDFANEARLLEFAESLTVESATLTDQQISEKIAMFEASLPYNCEHVVPQSWFAKMEPMRGDLHHLFACESGCNSFRGNTPYFDFDDFEEAVRDECGKREENRFEPGNGKGEVARATLYFLLRYPGEINRVPKEYTADRIAILLDWHAQFKVTKHELHRNAAIFAKQGNRNPLVDFPEWAGKIDFEKGLGL